MSSKPESLGVSSTTESLPVQYCLSTLSCVLQQITAKNDLMPASANHVTVFHALRPPSISIKNYLERIVKYAYCSPECFVLSLVYMDRIIQRNESFYITSLNVHRLMITSVMVAAKFFDDVYYNNAYYARVGGISCPEINSLEIEFLYLINFSLHVTPDMFEKYRAELMLHSMQVGRPCICGQEAVVAAEERKRSEISSASATTAVPRPIAPSVPKTVHHTYHHPIARQPSYAAAVCYDGS